MTRQEQQRFIRDLQEYTMKMSRDDLYQFEMLDMRNRDEEEFDAAAVRTLERLTATYVKRKTRADVEEIWKKLTEKNAQQKGQ
jgi:hypothetical protein